MNRAALRTISVLLAFALVAAYEGVAVSAIEAVVVIVLFAGLLIAVVVGQSRSTLQGQHLQE